MRTRGNGDAVAFSQVRLQRNAKSKLILRKIIEIVATIVHSLNLKFTKFDFGWGSAPYLLGELTALSDPLAGFKRPTSKGREGRKDERE